ncbi:hypothetical protein ABBQ32_010259 [Trebouxia sp. C0010 RCD-2024]
MLRVRTWDLGPGTVACCQQLPQHNQQLPVDICMGSAASKAPKRAFPKTGTLQRTDHPTSQTADHVHHVPPGSGAQPDAKQQSDQQEQEEVQEQDFLQQLKQEGVKHAELGSFLDKLGGAIAGKHVSTLDIKHGDAKQTLHQRKEAGRLDTAALRHLFQDVHRMEQSPEPIDLDSLSHRYGLDKSLLKKVIHFNRLPAVTQHADGRLLGSWQWKA